MLFDEFFIYVCKPLSFNSSSVASDDYICKKQVELILYYLVDFGLLGLVGIIYFIVTSKKFMPPLDLKPNHDLTFPLKMPQGK